MEQKENREFLRVAWATPIFRNDKNIVTNRVTAREGVGLTCRADLIGSARMRWNRSISLDGEQPITAGSGYSSQIGNPVAHWDGLGNGEWRMANGKWRAYHVS